MHNLPTQILFSSTDLLIFNKQIKRQIGSFQSNGNYSDLNKQDFYGEYVFLGNCNFSNTICIILSLSDLFSYGDFLFILSWRIFILNGKNNNVKYDTEYSTMFNIESVPLK